jgi:hypothetical protein
MGNMNRLLLIRTIDIFQYGVDLIIVVRVVREGAIRAVLDCFGFARIFKFPAALIAQ